VGRDSVSCAARKVDVTEVAERCSWGVSLHGSWLVLSGLVLVVRLETGYNKRSDLYWFQCQ
jgi:hypothetical protein